MMYKFEVSQNSGTFSRDNLPRSRQKDSRQVMFDDIGSRESKQNDSKHMNAIKPYVNKQRKNSKREIKPVSSQGEINRSRTKRMQSTSSNRKSIEQQSSMISCENISLLQNYPSVIRQKPTNEITKIYEQMITLKTEYKQLKTSYNNLVREKQMATSRQENCKLSYQKQTVHLKQEIQKNKKNNSYLESQVERIKRQCFKIIQSEKFKYKKLEQTLQQKELMIAYLRKQIQLLKRERLGINGNFATNTNNKQQLNASSISQIQQDNLQRIFFLQNSAPIFSYQTYARMGVNTSVVNGSANVLVQQSENSSQTPTQMGNNHNKNHRNKKRSQYEEDSLSFSRDKSRQFDSVHSLLSLNHNNNDDQTILTFTKKDKIVFDESFENCLENFGNNNKNNGQQSFEENQQPQCPTFQNRKKLLNKSRQKDKDKEIISFESLKAKRMLSKSDRAESKRSAKNSKQHTKRLEIMTDPYPDQKDKHQDQYSCDTKKKLSKNKIKNSKKVSKSQGLHNSIMSEVLHGSFIKKQSTTNVQSKSLHSNNSKRK